MRRTSAFFWLNGGDKKKGKNDQNNHTPQAPLSKKEGLANRNKTKTRARVEHIFGIMKRQFGYNKARYRGLDKNAHSVFTKCALINLVIAKRPLLAALAR